MLDVNNRSSYCYILLWPQGDSAYNNCILSLELVLYKRESSNVLYGNLYRYREVEIVKLNVAPGEPRTLCGN
jgi:hypothetical protein